MLGLSINSVDHLFQSLWYLTLSVIIKQTLFIQTRELYASSDVSSVKGCEPVAFIVIVNCVSLTFHNKGGAYSIAQLHF